jgi:hypothetical protein
MSAVEMIAWSALGLLSLILPIAWYLLGRAPQDQRKAVIKLIPAEIMAEHRALASAAQDRPQNARYPPETGRDLFEQLQPFAASKRPRNWNGQIAETKYVHESPPVRGYSH